MSSYPGYSQSPEQLLRIGEVARQLQVSVETVRRWERQGRLESIRTLGNQRRFRRSDVERVERGQAESA